MSDWLKVLLTLCAIAAAGAGYLYVFDPQLGRQLLDGTALEPAATVTTAFKWRDTKGNWQLTQEPPPEGTSYEVLEARSNDNIVPGLSTK